MSDRMKAAARGLGVIVGFIAVIAIAILITSNHDSSTSADSSESSDLQSQVDDLQSQLDDAHSCMDEANSYISDLQNSIDDAKNVSGGTYDDMASALDELDYSSAPSCLGY